jgi:D-alanyl-D-alanine carboxypeptidase/D-alanyl-D-alanine-endopeptidase (penicillin-binding protein 4)
LAVAGALSCLTVAAVPAAAATVSRAATAASGPATAAAAATARADLRAKLTDAFRGSTARHVDWRFDVDGVGSLRHDAARQTAPASNNKLFIGETALQVLGSDYRYDTEVRSTGTRTGHTLHGALVLQASGDPVLDRSDLARLARRVHRAGIRRVTRGVVVDDSRYGHRSHAPGWKKRFTPDQVGPVDAFAVDENAWSRSRAFIRHTGRANGGLFAAALRRHEVAVSGGTRVGRPAQPAAVTRERSEPLGLMVAYMLTESDNFVAEMLLDELGAAAGSRGGRKPGIAVVRAQAHALGVPLGAIHDGSGLSYSDRESPDSEVAWLDAAAASSSGAQLRDDLPVACRTGTLQDRLCGSATTGRVSAKTGTLTGVSALSGYLTTRSGRDVTFSVLLAGMRNPTAGVARIDRAVTAVAGFRR